MLPRQQNIIEDLRDEAKIPYGYNFFHFFRVFHMQHTYEDLIQFSQDTRFENNSFIRELVRKFCSSEGYDVEETEDGRQCWIEFEENLTGEPMKPIQIEGHPILFFGLMLYMMYILDFKIKDIEVYKYMIDCFLDEGRHDMIIKFVRGIDREQSEEMIEFKQTHHDYEWLAVVYAKSWIQLKYTSIQRQEQVIPALDAVEEVLQMVSKIRSKVDIQKEIAFY